jgi:uncharacterized protein (DUF1684 family)
MNMKKKRIAVLTVVAVVAGVVAVPALAQLADGRDDPLSKWKKSVIENRIEKDREFKTSPTSPMAAIQRVTIKPGAKTVFVIEKKQGVEVTPKAGSGLLFALTHKKGKWLWDKPADKLTCKLDNKDIPPGSALEYRTLLRREFITISAYPTKNGLVLIVFDSRRPMKRQFSKLLYFPPSKTYAPAATLEKYPKPDTIVMRTSQNLEKTYYRYARIHFELDGKELQLTALKADLKSKELFIPFNDTTNNNVTYAAGRFLSIPEPQNPQFTLDFNLCYNPLCNYADAYNCPIPPRENNLDVPIKAGELEYPHSKGRH